MKANLYPAVFKFGYLETHRQKCLNDIHVRPRVRRQASGSERTTSRQSHRQQELVGHVFAHGQPSGDISTDLLYHAVGAGLGTKAALPETGEYFGVIL